MLARCDYEREIRKGTNVLNIYMAIPHCSIFPRVEMALELHVACFKLSQSCGDCDASGSGEAGLAGEWSVSSHKVQRAAVQHIYTYTTISSKHNIHIIIRSAVYHSLSSMILPKPPSSPIDAARSTHPCSQPSAFPPKASWCSTCTHNH